MIEIKWEDNFTNRDLAVEHVCIIHKQDRAIFTAFSSNNQHFYLSQKIHIRGPPDYHLITFKQKLTKREELFCVALSKLTFSFQKEASLKGNVKGTRNPNFRFGERK